MRGKIFLSLFFLVLLFCTTVVFAQTTIRVAHFYDPAAGPAHQMNLK